MQKVPGNEHDPSAHFWSIASLLYSPERENNLKEPQPSKVHGAVLPPDEHLACFDYLYYVCAHTVRDFFSSVVLHSNGHRVLSIGTTLVLHGDSSPEISVGLTGFKISATGTSDVCLKSPIMNLSPL